MKRTVLLATAVVLIGMAPVSAMDMKCDNATMKEMNTKIMGMKDDAMKKEAMGQMDMAKSSMEGKKMDDCMMHMNAAQKSMGNM